MVFVIEVIRLENDESKQKLKEGEGQCGFFIMYQHESLLSQSTVSLPDVKEPEISLDPISKVVGISWLSTVGHGEMRSKSLDLVLVRLHLYN